MNHSLIYAFHKLREEAYEINSLMDDIYSAIEKSEESEKGFFIDMFKWVSLLMGNSFIEALAIRKELGII